MRVSPVRINCPIRAVKSDYYTGVSRSAAMRRFACAGLILGKTNTKGSLQSLLPDTLRFLFF